MQGSGIFGAAETWRLRFMLGLATVAPPAPRDTWKNARAVGRQQWRWVTQLERFVRLSKAQQQLVLHRGEEAAAENDQPEVTGFVWCGLLFLVHVHDDGAQQFLADTLRLHH